MMKILTLCIAVIVIFISFGLLPIHGEDEIYDNVIRLHVIANSDSYEDQDLKLKVRDSVLEIVNGICDDKEIKDNKSAKKVIEQNLDIITETARQRVLSEGYDYKVDVQFLEENYPTKNYESVAFPSGKYLSLQVLIGEADGANWWCVLFPPLCLSAASEINEAEFIKIGFTGEQYRMITDSSNAKYNVRFKILETAQKVIS